MRSGRRSEVGGRRSEVGGPGSEIGWISDKGFPTSFNARPSKAIRTGTVYPVLAEYDIGQALYYILKELARHLS